MGILGSEPGHAIDRFVNPGYADQILKGWSRPEAFTTERG